MNPLIGQTVSFIVAHRKKAGGNKQKNYPQEECCGRIRNIIGDTAIIETDDGGVYNRFLKDTVAQEVIA